MGSDVMQAVAGDSLRLEKGCVNEIPFLFCFMKDDKPKPLVILSHAFGGSKDMWTGNLRELASLGYYAVALDNRGHGERKGATFESVAFVEGKVDVCAVRMLIKETADDIPTLIDLFVAQDEVDGDRIGMVGVSMGGFVTFRALVIENRIRVAAPVIASPYWDDIPKDMAVIAGSGVREALEGYSMKYSPARHVDRFYPRALLIQVGDKDVHFNLERVVQFHRKLETHYYDAPDKIKLVVHEGTRHEFTPPMWTKVKNWLQTHL
jgi:pimeloyl-ACP methyl ester carboxylesterase